jgi:hypothetical protein
MDQGEISSLLAKYEKKYGMASDEFYSLFTSGKLDDRKDFIIWAGIFDMRDASVSKVVHA